MDENYGMSQEAILGNGNHRSFGYDPEPLPDYLGPDDTAEVRDADDIANALAEFGL